MSMLKNLDIQLLRINGVERNGIETNTKKGTLFHQHGVVGDYF